MSDSNNCSQPSTSRLLDTLENRVNKKLDRVKKKLLPKDKKTFFVPSTTTCVGDLTAPVTSVATPDVTQNRESSSGHANMPLLMVDTFGGECAGSGYDSWLNQDGVQQEIESVIIAQEAALRMVKSNLVDSQQALDCLKLDEQRLNDFLVSSFRDLLGSTSDQALQKLPQLEEEISCLEQEIANLRTLSPRCVPPERPPRPSSSLSWQCLYCAMDSPLFEYRCTHCQFPRPAIDPTEAQRCNCSHCTVAVGEIVRL